MRRPRGWGLFAVWVVWTALQGLPWPGLRAIVAPLEHAWVEAAQIGTSATLPGLSTSVADTWLEVARWLTLAAVFGWSAQFSWRWTAAVVAGGGTGVVAIGFMHEILRLDRIYGLYAPLHGPRADVPALMGPFVNPNHQSGFLLLGLFAAWGLAVDLRRRALDPTTRTSPERLLDRAALMTGAAWVQGVGLLLSLSRAAMVVAAVLGVVAWLLARQGPSAPHRSRHQSRTLRVLLGVALLILIVVVAQHGALRELATLADRSSAVAKFGTVWDAGPMVGETWIAGSGRGTFIDRFGRFDHAPSRVWVTHLECVPLTMLIEWGVFVGGLSVLALVGAWLRMMRRSRRREDGIGRRIVGLGLAAVAVQSLADASLEFMGVTTSLVALAGSLAEKVTIRDGRRTLVGLTAVGLVIAIAIGWTVGPRTWSRRAFFDATHEGAALEAALGERPLDARLQLRIARESLRRGDALAAHTRARVAVGLHPGLIDGWLLLAAVADQDDDPAARDDAMRTALALLETPPSADLVRYLVRLYPDPRTLAALAPTERRPWSRLLVAVEDVSFAHADALLRQREEDRPHDPEPPLLRARAARRAGHAAMALHAARIARHRDPLRADTQLEVVHALMMARPSRRDDAIAALEQAIARVEAPEQLGVLEEHLVRLLSQRGGASDGSRIDALLASLRQRPATAVQRRARERLRADVRALR